MIKSYRELMVWQKAMQLTQAVYEMTSMFPKSETYGLSSQLRRCAVSVPSNIAEGHSRNSMKEYIHFLSIAQGSTAEMETQISLAGMLNYIEAEDEILLLEQANEVGKMLRGLQTKLNQKLLEPNT